jgi:LuxR family transcriptional regulator, maltose regulon positive regulatory protein
LHTHLIDERPDEISGLHLRASQWYTDAGEPVAAVRHALAAGDVERAADLVELAIPGMQRDRQEATIRGWLDDLPDTVVRTRPVLAMGLIGGLMSRGEFDGVEERLADVERVLGASTDYGSATEMVVVDPDQLDRLPGAIEMYRAALALVRGVPSATISHAERAIDRAATDDHVIRAGAAALSGLARWGNGDLDAAHAAYSVAVDGLHRAGHVADVLGCSITLSDIRITQGRLTDAQHTYEEALRLASRESDPVRGTPDMHVGLSRIAWERGDLQTAVEHLRRAQELGEAAGLPQNAYRWRVAMAGVLDAQGNHAGALDMLEEAEHVFTSDFSPNVRPVAATRARLLIVRGKLTEARDWASREGLSADDDLSYVREYEHVTLARLLLAQHMADRSEAPLRVAAELLERLLVAADAGGRNGSAIEILALLARAHHASRDITAALAALERALTIAEPEGYVAVFTSEGQPITALLAELTRRRPDWAYARRLLDATDRPVEPAPDARRTGKPIAARQALVEPLSDRELEVLRLLATDLDGPDIARQLNVSLNTLRTHTKHIYTKLGATSRRAAVSRAAQLNLLSRTTDR